MRRNLSLPPMVLRDSIFSLLMAPMLSMSPRREPRRVTEDGSVGWRFGTAICGSEVVADLRLSMVERESAVID